MSFKSSKFSMSIYHSVAIILIIGIILILEQCSKQVKLSANKVKEDFKYLYQTLEASSYDLFLSTDKETFDQEYDRIYMSITDSLSFLEINKLFQSFVALSNFSHCHVSFPYKSYRGFYRNEGRRFPLVIYFIDNKPRVLLDYSENENIAIGDEIIKINEQPIESILNKMYAYISGENEYLRRTMMEMTNFMRNYWYTFGDFDKSLIQLKKSNGEIKSVQVEGVSLDEYKTFVKNNTIPSSFNRNRNFKFIKKTAYLHPGIFLNNDSRSGSISDHNTFNNDEFIKFIDSAFVEISKNNSQDLIIDLRNNSGGDNTFSDHMIAYIANKPFRIASKFQIRTSQMTKKFWKDVNKPELDKLKSQIMNLKNGERFEADLDSIFPRNDKYKFNGKVYVLINRYSYSNAANVASIIQDYGFGTLIGEETATVPSTCGGVHEFQLPNTNMNVVYPKVYGIRPSGDTSLRGVIPDYHVEHNLFTETDEALEFALRLINSNKK